MFRVVANYSSGFENKAYLYHPSHHRVLQLGFDQESKKGLGGRWARSATPLAPDPSPACAPSQPAGSSRRP